MISDGQYLNVALKLALQRQGFCAPNPAVGAVVVKQDIILATGVHWATGHPHAEVDALKKIAPEQARGATLYVTLEPCCIWERTPPCTTLLIEYGIARVVYGMQDPNPKVAGKGIAMLQAAGIACECVRSLAIAGLYRSYVRWRQMQLPWVTAKLALSSDLKIAGVGGARVQMSSARLAVYTQQQRLRHDAILTTVRTVMQDDPQFNVRFIHATLTKPIYVLDTQLQFPVSARLCASAASLTLLHSDEVDVARREVWQSRGVKCVAIPMLGDELDWHAVLSYIAHNGYHRLWVEAGNRCFTSLATSGYLQQAILYIAPLILGQTAYSGIDAWAQTLGAQRLVWQAVGKELVAEATW